MKADSSRKLNIAFKPVYAHPLPEGHRFPMLKYELIPEQLLYEGCITAENLFVPNVCSEDTLLLTHTIDYVAKLKQQTLSQKEQRHIGFPQSPLLTEREFIITQGTIDCSLLALQNGMALNVAGGTHHAFSNRGEGFCLLNDFAVASNYLLHQHLVKQILIIDLDVHQGNGSAKIFENEGSQAVQLPQSCRFTGSEVFVSKIGDIVVLTPQNSHWLGFLTSLNMFTDDYMGNGRMPILWSL